MNRILYILTAALLIISCGDENGEKGLTFEQKMCREWHSVTLSAEGDIYLKFEDDKTFEIYQQIGDGRHKLYRGTWNLENNLLTGRYNDGEDWASAYTVTMHDKFLTLVSANDAAEESVFEKTEIPAEVKERCEIIVRSSY